MALSLCAVRAGAQPAPPGLPADVQQGIEQAIKSEMARDNIPGLSIAVAVDGVVRWANGYGLADLENLVPAKVSTMYRLASVTKPITATAVMQLVEAGKLDLDAPIQRYAPTFPQKQWPVTARHLLSHVSGIRNYQGDEQDSTKLYPTLTAGLEMFEDDPLVHQPGTKYLYSSYNFNLLAVAVEGASGSSFFDYVRSHVFEPAGMEQIRVDEVAAIIPNRAQGYCKLPDGALRNSALADTSYKHGMCATVVDLARFAVAFQSGKLVKPQTVEQMWTPNPVSLRRARAGDEIGYGLGWNIIVHEGERQPFHAGNQQRVTNLLFTRPERRVVIAMMSNLENAHLTVALARQLSDIVLGNPAGEKATAIGNAQPQRPAADRPAPDLRDAAYGPHERNVLDLWKAKSATPTPLVIFLHGGGFKQGDKGTVYTTLLRGSLAAGFSVASLNYRLTNVAPFPAPMLDGVRAIQFLRSRSAEWNLDPARFAACGTSAGGGIALWAAFHDDFAKSDSNDSVERQSSRLKCVGGWGVQPSYDPRFIRRHIGGSDISHSALLAFYGLPREQFDTPKAYALFEAASPINYLTADDPPAFLFYNEGPPVPLPADAPEVEVIHHAQFGSVLKEKMQALGIRCEVRTVKAPGPGTDAGTRRTAMDAEMVKLLGECLGGR